MQDSPIIEHVPKRKTSKLAQLSAVLVFFILILSQSLYWLSLLSVLALISGILALKNIKKSKGQLRGRWLAVFGLIIAVPFFVWSSYMWLISFDAPPIPNDYTIADFRSAGPEYAESFHLLRSLADEEGIDPNSAPAIGLNVQDVRTICEIHDLIETNDLAKIAGVVKDNTENIEQIWGKAQKGRDIIHRLNSFRQIADLTEQSLEANIDFVVNLKRLAILYNLQLYLRCEKGINESDLAEFLELDSVFRKLSINSRTTMTELVCYAYLSRGIQAANFIANNPITSRESMESLAGHFLPLTEEQLSLQNSLICEYLVSKNALDKILEEWGIGLRRNPVLKRNSTLRMSKNYCDFLISTMEGHEKFESSELSVWPSIYHPWLPHVHVDKDRELPWYYTCYNPIGSVLFQIIAPSYERIFELKLRLEVHDDLLQIVLNKRLGRGASLKARAYSDDYIIDAEKKIIFSPGPDGKSYTKDDIKLPINPQVLNLAK